VFAHLGQNLDEEISGMRGAQEGQSPITAEGYEVQVAAAVEANQIFDHGRAIL
jgi:hypothetical protein